MGPTGRHGRRREKLTVCAPKASEKAGHKQSSNQIHGIFLYYAAGYMVAVSDAVLLGNTDFADHDYYRYHRDLNDDNLHIGKVIRSRLTGELILPGLLCIITL